MRVDGDLEKGRIRGRVSTWKGRLLPWAPPGGHNGAEPQPIHLRGGLAVTSRGRDLPALAVALTTWMVVAAWLWTGPHTALLTWDEVDYLTAARLGPAANALDSGGLGLGGLLEMVRAKSQGDSPELPPGYEESADPVVVRHYHPPGMVYPHLPSANAGEWITSMRNGDVMIYTDSDTVPGFGFLKLTKN